MSRPLTGSISHSRPFWSGRTLVIFEAIVDGLMQPASASVKTYEHGC